LLQGKTKKFLDFVPRSARLAGLTGNRTNKQKIMKLFTDKDIISWQNNGETYHKLNAEQNELLSCPLWWQIRGLRQTASGYGRKLVNGYKINFEGKLYRLYTTCFSNCGSTWFTVRGKKIFVN
jgi:hypothetical protein